MAACQVAGNRQHAAGLLLSCHSAQRSGSVMSCWLLHNLNPHHHNVGEMLFQQKKPITLQQAQYC